MIKKSKTNIILNGKLHSEIIFKESRIYGCENMEILWNVLNFSKISTIVYNNKETLYRGYLKTIAMRKIVYFLNISKHISEIFVMKLGKITKVQISKLDFSIEEMTQKVFMVCRRLNDRKLIFLVSKLGLTTLASQPVFI